MRVTMLMDHSGAERMCALAAAFYLNKKEETLLNRSTQKKNRWWLLLLAIPCIVLFCPPLYNLKEPLLFGIPFFYWFQMFWIVVGASITALVYFLSN
jgi:hypothetical protein